MSQSRPNLIRSPPASAAGAAFILLPLTRRSSKAPTAQPWRPSRAPLVPLGRPPRGPSPVRSEPTGAAWSAAGLLDQESLAAVDLFYAALPNLKHDKEGHPEQGPRVPAILDALEKHQLRGMQCNTQELLELVNLRPATPEEVAAVHIPNYARELPNVCATKGPGILEAGGPTYFTSASSDAAFRSAGAGIQLIDMVVASAKARKASGGGAGAAGFGACRPPGHHAVPKGPMGFCIFNNVSIMARYAQRTHGLSKVMIFDFDVHHGNGTQDMFYDDDSVLFVSTHQDGGYPGTGLLSEVGIGRGEGYSINLPLPGDSGNYAMVAAFEEVVAPAARRFQPDIILVSAGYDAHWRDPLAGLQYRTASYHWLTASIKRLADDLCDGRVVFMLEGGYDLKALGESVTNSFLALLGRNAKDSFNPALLRDEPGDRIRAAILECRKIHEL